MTTPANELQIERASLVTLGGQDSAASPSHRQIAALAREWAADIGQILDSRA
jgi:hypothetical protein